MRIYITTSASKETVPFNYQPMLTAAFHKWIGKNSIHDKTSLYSFSWLNGGRVVKNGIKIDQSGHFFISAYEQEIIKSLIRGIQDDAFIGSGLYVQEIAIAPDLEDLNQQERLFYSASPILVKRSNENREIHYHFNDIQSDVLLTETLKYKLKMAGLQDEGVSVAFDRNYPAAKTKVIYYKSIGNKVNICPVLIKGTAEQIAFAWNVGIGNSTGIGFGALK